MEKLPWDKLGDDSKRKAYRKNDERVPPGWTPEVMKEERRRAKAERLKNETPAEKEARILRSIQEVAARKANQQQVEFWYYTHPDAVIDLTKQNVHLSTEELMALAERTWDDQGISPKNVIFRVNGQTVLTLPNPNVKTGPTFKYRKMKK